MTAPSAAWERRVDETVTSAFAAARATAKPDARAHVAEAWLAAYGRDPDPDKAYDEVVLTIEVVASPLNYSLRQLLKN